MKPKPDLYDQLDDIAKEAMICLLNGTYSHPAILIQMDEVAVKNKRSLSQEIAHRSYEMAAIMLQTRKQYIGKNGNND